MRQASRKYRSNVILVNIPSVKNKLNIKKCLEYLAKQDINNIFLESGSHLMNSFLQEKLIDELLLYISPKILGQSAISFSGISNIEKLSKKIEYRINDMITINKDLKLRLERHNV